MSSCNNKNNSKTNPNSLTSAQINVRSLDMSDFKEKVLNHYLNGTDDQNVDADELLARSILPPGTAQARNFSSVAFEYPAYNASQCVACMECVVECPDAAIYARVTPEPNFEQDLEKISDPELKEAVKNRFTKTQKYWELPQKKGMTPSYFSIWVDPDKCKGCGECVAVCDSHGALSMVHKETHPMSHEKGGIDFIRKDLTPTPHEYLNDKLLVDLFLIDDHWVYRGGAGACRGCGEITALKMALTATSAKYGKDMVLVAATGCNSVFSSTYPYNIFNVPWANPLFENAPATAQGVRMRLDQTGKKDTKVWVIGGDGAMSDIGFQSLSRMVASGANINVLVLDTQVYSNTGGQASSSTFLGQNAKMSYHGRDIHGKTEHRKELGKILMAHPDAYVAQVSPAYYNHFLRAVLGALEYNGPSVIIAYSPCMPEHGIADDSSFEQSKSAVISRAFPLFVYDPRNGDTFKERLDLRGNPSINNDWHIDNKTQTTQDFIWFAKSEERFAKMFDKEGQPEPEILESQLDRLRNWKTLKELAGVPAATPHSH